MYTANHEIKSLIKSLGFNQAKVASEMGISCSYFTKLLQLPLSPQWTRRVNKAVCELIEKRRKDENEFVSDYKKVVRQHAKFNK